MENDQQQKVKEEEQSAAEAYRESGNLQFKKGDFREAVKLYTESIKQAATAAAYANRAQAYISLECYDMESKQNFRRYIQLLKPASINIAKFSDALWDFTPHMRILDPTTKLLVLYLQFYCGSMDSKMQVNWNDTPRMRFVYLSIQSALAWLHAPPPMDKPSRCWNPPKPAPVARKEDVHLGSTTDQKLGQCQELTNLWRHPAAKILCIGEGNLFDGKEPKKKNFNIDVDVLIDECHKLFHEAKSRLNYSLKVMCQRGSNDLYSENGTKWKSPETLKPRAFANNMLGEQLHVSIQRLTLDNPHTRALMPPHYLVIIERFHT